MGNSFWRDIPGWDGLYQASTDGDIKSTRSGKILAVTLTPLGYGYVSLNMNGKQYKKSVHGLVARAFYGLPADGYEVHHKDSNRINNALENLEYVTHSENIKHSWAHGRITRKRQERQRGVNHFNIGSDNPGSKLNGIQVSEIQKLLAQKKQTINEIAKQYNVTAHAVSAINRGYVWRSIGDYDYPIRTGHIQRGALQPFAFSVGNKRRVKCPTCSKEMSRQGWQLHPCKLKAEKEAA